MTREIQYDNDERGRFYVVDYQNGREECRLVLTDVHDFVNLCTYIEQRSRSYPGYILKPVPGLHKKLLEENKRGIKLEFTNNLIAMDLGLK